MDLNNNPALRQLVETAIQSSLLHILYQNRTYLVSVETPLNPLLNILDTVFFPITVYSVEQVVVLHQQQERNLYHYMGKQHLDSARAWIRFSLVELLQQSSLLSPRALNENDLLVISAKLKADAERVMQAHHFHRIVQRTREDIRHLTEHSAARLASTFDNDVAAYNSYLSDLSKRDAALTGLMILCFNLLDNLHSIVELGYSDHEALVIMDQLGL